MKKFFVDSNFDKLKLEVMILEPKKKPKGIVQIAHGMAEYKERYLPFMEYLQSNGYVVVIHDHRGHGKSVKTNEDFGYFYDDTAEGIVEELHQITNYIKKEYPNLPITLFGHSMGSMVVRIYIKKYDADIDKLIVCGSPSENPQVNMGIWLVKFLKIFKGERYRSQFVQNLTFGKSKKKVSDNEWICSDGEVIKKYDKDDACGFIFTLNGFQNLFLLMKKTYTAEDYLVCNPNLNILFLAGADDKIILNRTAWKDAQLFLKDVGYEHVKGILYSNMRHEILNEDGKEKVYEDILDFISS